MCRHIQTLEHCFSSFIELEHRYPAVVYLNRSEPEPWKPLTHRLLQDFGIWKVLNINKVYTSCKKSNTHFGSHGYYKWHHIPLRAKPQGCADECSQYRLVSDHHKTISLIINKILVKRQSRQAYLWYNRLYEHISQVIIRFPSKPLLLLSKFFEEGRRHLRKI